VVTKNKMLSASRANSLASLKRLLTDMSPRIPTFVDFSPLNAFAATNTNINNDPEDKNQEKQTIFDTTGVRDSGSEVGGVWEHISVNNGDFWGSARLLEYLVFLIIEK